MSRQQVVNALGEPDYSMSKNDSEHLYYSYSEALNRSTSGYGTDDFERKVEALERSFHVTQYEVVLTNGKLVSYKELTD